MTNSHVAINSEICTKKILDFVFINKLPQIQSCHSNDVTPTCNWSGFMVRRESGGGVSGGLRAAGVFAQLHSLSMRTQEWISLFIFVQILNYPFTFP